jgi:hypothetical protein
MSDNNASFCAVNMRPSLIEVAKEISLPTCDVTLHVCENLLVQEQDMLT